MASRLSAAAAAADATRPAAAPASGRGLGDRPTVLVRNAGRPCFAEAASRGGGGGGGPRGDPHGGPRGLRTTLARRLVRGGLLVVATLLAPEANLRLPVPPFVPGLFATSSARSTRDCSLTKSCATALSEAPRADASLLEVSTVEEYHKLIKEHSGPVVAVFSSPFCGPCLLTEPQVETMAAEFAPQLKVIKLMLAGRTVKAFKEISSALEVRTLPTFVVYHKEAVVGRVTGAKVPDLRSLVQEYL